MNQFYTQNSTTPPESRSYLQDEVPKNWDVWSPLPSDHASPAPPINTAGFVPGVPYIACVISKTANPAGGLSPPPAGSSAGEMSQPPAGSAGGMSQPPAESSGEGSLLAVTVLPPDTDYSAHSVWRPAFLAVPPDVFLEARESDLFEGVLYSKLHEGTAIFITDNPEMNFRVQDPSARELQSLDNADSTVNKERRLELEDGYLGKISPDELANLRWDVQCAIEGRSTGFHIRTNSGPSYYHPWGPIYLKFKGRLLIFLYVNFQDTVSYFWCFKTQNRCLA